MKFDLYYIASATKLVLGISILLIIYTGINVYEDPGIGIGLSLLGLFIASWGLSFFAFLGAQKFFRNENTPHLRIVKDSYKLSLLFGIYVMINVLLILSGNRSKFIGLILFVAFILLQVALFADKKS